MNPEGAPAVQATSAQHEKIIEHLDMLNKQVAKQSSLSHMFMVGVVYGIGFVVGSAVLATIALGIFGPLIGKIPWVQASYESGTSLRR
jgi:hypothetical protein